jgi:hypothetical protein
MNVMDSVAAAVEEQTVTTNEMGRYVTQAADSATAVAIELGDLVEAASSASINADQTDSAIAVLYKMLSQLQTFVATFKIPIEVASEPWTFVMQSPRASEGYARCRSRIDAMRHMAPNSSWVSAWLRHGRPAPAPNRAFEVILGSAKYPVGVSCFCLPFRT